MKVRAYQPDDFEAFMEMWTQRSHMPRLPQSFLPHIGRVVESDGYLLAAAFLVQSDTGMASLAFVCGSPGFTAVLRGEALDMVLNDLRTLAKEIGYTSLGAASNVPALQRRFEKLGLQPTDKNVICYGGLL